jgi:PCFT/HCP family folate transporter-like MFS transporter 1/3
MESATKSKTYSALYVKLFPFELIYLLFQFSEHFYRYLYQQYFFQRLNRAALENFNYTDYNESVCLTQDIVVNYTGRDEFGDIQAAVNHLSMYDELIFLLLSAVMGIIMGPLSDIIGRKPIMISVQIGLVLSALLQFFVFRFDLPVYYYLLCSVLIGAFGGFVSMMTIILAVIYDVTPAWLFTVRIGVVESCIAIARGVTSFGSNDWIQATGCDFQPASWLMLAITGLSFAVIVFMPETISKEQRNDNMKQRNKGFNKILNGLKIYTRPSFIGWTNYWQLYTAIGVLCLASFGIGANNLIMNYYLHNKPLEWSYDDIGSYGLVSYGCMGVSLVVILPVLKLFRIPNPVICLIGSLSAVISNGLLANITTRWAIFAIGGVQSLFILTYPTMRAIISSLVSSECQGSVFSIATGLQSIAAMISTVVCNEVYRPQIGSTNSSGVIFWVMAGAWSATLPLILYVSIHVPHHSFP